MFCVSPIGVEWNEVELERGKLIRIRGFPADKKMKLVRVTVFFQFSHRTDFVVSNDTTQNLMQTTTNIDGTRRKIKAVHQERN
jgi:hypothetical protein